MEVDLTSPDKPMKHRNEETEKVRPEGALHLMTTSTKQQQQRQMRMDTPPSVIAAAAPRRPAPPVPLAASSSPSSSSPPSRRNPLDDERRTTIEPASSNVRRQNDLIMRQQREEVEGATSALQILGEQQHAAFDSRLRLLSMREMRLHEWEQQLREWEEDLLRREELLRRGGGGPHTWGVSRAAAPSSYRQGSSSSGAVGQTALHSFDERLHAALMLSQMQQ